MADYDNILEIVTPTLYGDSCDIKLCFNISMDGRDSESPQYLTPLSLSLRARQELAPTYLTLVRA